jgi:hypothetical protein
VRLNVEFKKQAVETKIKALMRNLPKEADIALTKAAVNLSSNIKRRVAQGRGLNGSPFPSYDPKYAKLRVKRGRSAAPVDLNFTGKMLGSMNGSLDRKGVAKVSFTGLAQAKKAYFTDQRRPWFGVDRDGRRVVKETILRHFRARKLI